MLALVSVSLETKDLNPVLAAHIYTVCPIAIPSLPTPAEDASEDEVMESLGMLKNKDGNFETFERFLGRTEVRHLSGLFQILCIDLRNIIIFTGNHFAGGRHHGITATKSYFNGRK